MVVVLVLVVCVLGVVADCSTSAVPNSFGPRDQCRRRSFFHSRGLRGETGGREVEFGQERE